MKAREQTGTMKAREQRSPVPPVLKVPLSMDPCLLISIWTAGKGSIVDLGRDIQQNGADCGQISPQGRSDENRKSSKRPYYGQDEEDTVARLFKNVNWKILASLFGLVVVVALLWNTKVVYPIKILVVFFHEISHGLAAVISGGSIVKIEVVAQEGGLCVTRGGSRFLTLSAGYLGSLIWGGIILLLAARTRLDRGVSVALGTILLLVSFFFVRPFGSFGFLFGVACGVVLVGIGLALPEGINDYLLRLIGLTSCLYAVLDIKSDILDRPNLRSDAVMLAELTGIPSIFWGGLWIIIAVVVSFVFLVVACKTTGTQRAIRSP
jgi:hypothetical protein